ncbi:MAG TPA: phosphatase PAP2 family protein [Jatrophihabitans sp.]|nr:phosphatase PAP2 family protein [Jatrophihabitans sp.]
MSTTERIAAPAAGRAGAAAAGPAPGPAARRTARARDGLRQLAFGLLIWGGYLLITHAVAVDLGAAVHRGQLLLAAERQLRLAVEPAADSWLAHHRSLGRLAAWEYATTYIATTFAVLGWLWWRRPASYRWARNTLAGSTLLALACFYLAPTAPPRLLPGAGFTDIVARVHPVLSWGGGTVASTADQYAAMPSLHVGWAVWVTVVSLRAGATRLGYSLAALHLAVTTAVVVATGNHYVLDCLAGAVIVAIAAGMERIRTVASSRWRPAGSRVAAADEFFLQVETPTVQQPVGGVALLDLTRADGPVDLARLRRVVRGRIGRMPRFQQRLAGPSRWWHARWVPAAAVIDEHVLEYRLPGGGRPALAEFVSRLTEQQLDRDRPPWRLWFVPEVAPGQAAVVAVMHHAVADGLGVVDILRQLFDPELPAPELAGPAVPSRPARLALAATGIGQLARDGFADRLPYTGRLTGERTFRCARTPLAPVLDLARRTGTRVTDVLLAATGEALARLECQGLAGTALRAAVPVTTRLPAPAGTGRAAQPGNLTAALRLDVPLAAMDPLDRLRAVHAAAAPRRRSPRPLGAAAVIRLLGLLPPVLHRPAARSVYRGRHFGAIVSNMPGPSVPLSLAGAPIQDVYPILPLAERVPLGVGALGWAGQFCVSVTADAVRLPAAGSLAERIVEAIEAMQAAAGSMPGWPAAGPDRVAG